MTDILSYISSFIPANYGLLRYCLVAVFSLLAIDTFFAVVVALFGRFFR